jgi:hypothetical protein
MICDLVEGFDFKSLNNSETFLVGIIPTKDYPEELKEIYSDFDVVEQIASPIQLWIENILEGELIKNAEGVIYFKYMDNNGELYGMAIPYPKKK